LGRLQSFVTGRDRPKAAGQRQQGLVKRCSSDLQIIQQLLFANQLSLRKRDGFI
jgi:hypothetical protein